MISQDATYCARCGSAIRSNSVGEFAGPQVNQAQYLASIARSMDRGATVMEEMLTLMVIAMISSTVAIIAFVAWILWAMGYVG